MPAVGVLVRCTYGSWMTRPPQSCPRGHRLGLSAMLVGVLKEARWEAQQNPTDAQ